MIKFIIIKDCGLGCILFVKCLGFFTVFGFLSFLDGFWNGCYIYLFFYIYNFGLMEY